MAGNGIELGNFASVRARLQRARRRGPERLRAATEAALELIEKRAKQILGEEVYGKPRGDDPDPPDRGDSDALYNRFAQELLGMARTSVTGVLSNDSGHAKFLEFGTD
jgi:hypothetical protein